MHRAFVGFNKGGEGYAFGVGEGWIERVLQRLGLNETTWEDAKGKYEKLAGRAI